MRPIRKPRSIAVREDGHDARRAFRRRAVDGSDAAFRHCAPNDGAVRDTPHVELRGVPCGAGHFVLAVDAADGLADERGCHARAPAVSTARTMVRCISSILKSLWPRP